MVIQRVEIANFRSLKSVDVPCSELIAILGRNGAGKSTILHALDMFYNTAAQVTEFDYFDRDITADISIRVTYGDLRADEMAEFSAYVTDSTLIVTKVINSGGARYYAASRQCPDFVEIRKLAATPKRAAFNELVDSGRFPDLIQRANSAQAVESAMADFESRHPELLQVIQKETQFFGPRNVGGGKLDKFTKFVLVPAVRDASSETERKGAILQLIDILVLRSVNARRDVRDLNAEFERRVKEVYSSDNLTELRSLGDLITDVLKRYAPGAKLDLSFGEVVPPKLALPPAVASLVEDNFKCPISYTGHGLQRALIFALLQQLSLTEQSSPEVSESPGDEAAGAPPPTRIPDLILAIEEPELYLHPSRCRYLSNVMLQLSRIPEDASQPRTQIVYGTHSPHFVDLKRFDQIRLARKVIAANTTTLQTKISSFSTTSASQRLAAISGRDPAQFTATSFVAHAAPVMTTIVNEGFFSDVTVVVEGNTEVGALWTLQSIQNRDWDGLGITIVPVVGKNNIDRSVVVFRGLEIPTYFVFDADSSSTGRDREAAIRSNGRLLRLAGVDIMDFPATTISRDWAVFNDNIEAEFLLALGRDVFDEIRAQVALELGYSQSSGVLKNIEASSLFVRKVYERRLRLPVLEELVIKITNLRSSSLSPAANNV
ncbi:MAG: ATP-dependent endonuclease [Bacteroidetes bacterium]|nr:ATP-dependent endonuclease [Bacteroidota bacterium]